MDILQEHLNAEPGEQILVIDDEPSVVSALKHLLEEAQYQVTTCSDAHEALTKLEATEFALILCDLKMPAMTGIDFLRELRARGLKPCVVMMSAYGGSDTVLECVRLGATDFVAKPFHAEELLLVLRKSQERTRLRQENELLKAEVAKRYSFQNIVAESTSMNEIFDTIRKIADYRTTVLITGESGTGKELVARALHYNSQRKSKRFVAINCGAIPENLLESELFGHRKGAFTDATRDKKGLFEEADGGTLFLDEIGELPPHLQVKLLRVLQEGEIRPVGDTRVLTVNVRVIAATLRNLENDILEERFRDDLYYRLNVVTLRVPALRERREDIPLLVNHFMKKNRDKLGVSIFGIAREAMERLLEYPWPGNIRELENCLERAMILSEGETITIESLPKTLRDFDQTTVAEKAPRSITLSDEENFSIKTQVRELEIVLIRRALEKTNGNRTHAAKLLDISHRTLLYKLKEYGFRSAEDEATSPEE